jgi:hypothetical protein
MSGCSGNESAPRVHVARLTGLSNGGRVRETAANWAQRLAEPLFPVQETRSQLVTGLR